MKASHTVVIAAEITLHVANDLSVLARLFAALAEQQQGILAWCFLSKHERTTVLLVTESAEQAAQLLQAIGFDGETKPVMALKQQHQSESASQFRTDLLAAGINILDAYACNSPHNGGWLVLSTTDDARAAELLETMDLLQEQPSGSPA